MRQLQKNRAKLDFEAWLAHPDQGITIHPHLELKCHADSDEYGVYAKADIGADTIVMSVPKTMLLTPRTCGISNLLQQQQHLYEEEEEEEADAANSYAMTAINLAYLYEYAQGRQSPWHAYLTSCPSVVSIAKLWSKTDQRVLKGTEVAMVGGTTLSDFKETYKRLVVPFLQKHKAVLGEFGQTLSFQEFCRGMSVVGSRAFEIDAYHGLGMCPFADMLDHEVEEHVHFQTAFDVCPECGELGGCEHDPDESEDDDEDEDGYDFDDEEHSDDLEFHDKIDAVMDDDEQDSDDEQDNDEQDNDEKSDEEAKDSGTIAPHKNPSGQAQEHIHGRNCHHHNGHGVDDGDDDDKGNEEEEEEEEEEESDCCEFIVTRLIKAGSQVYNTYGDLGNDVLLARYGFALRHNPHDKISLSSEVYSTLTPYREWFETNAQNLMHALHRKDQDEDDFMQITAPSHEATKQEEDDDENLEDKIYINVRGHLSEPLLVYLLVSTIPEPELSTKSGPEVLTAIQELLRAWQYVQPGNMPLPRYINLDAVKSVKQVIARLRDLLHKRRGRYIVPHAELDRRNMEKHMEYALIVRDCEEEIIVLSEAYLASMGRACAWLLQR